MKISVLDQSQFRGIPTSIDVRNIIFYGLLIDSVTPFLRDFFALEFRRNFENGFQPAKTTWDLSN
jgi:hypothetical protein